MWFPVQKSLLAQLKMSCGNVSLAQRVGRVRRRILPGKGLWSASSDALSCGSRRSQEASLTLGVFHIVLLSCPIGCLVNGYVPVGIFSKVDFWKHFALRHLIWLMNHVWVMTFCQNAKSCKISIAVKEFPSLFFIMWSTTWCADGWVVIICQIGPEFGPILLLVCPFCNLARFDTPLAYNWSSLMMNCIKEIPRVTIKVKVNLRCKKEYPLWE